MLPHLIKHANIQGVASNAKVTGAIPATGTHLALFLRCLTSAGAELTVAQMKAEVSDIVVRLDGRQIVDADATFLLNLQQYYGNALGGANVNGIIPIYYDRPYLSRPEDRVRTALGMLNIQSYAVEIDLLTCTNLASIEVYALRLPITLPLGEHMVITKVPENLGTAAGLDEITDLPGLRDARRAYTALHIFCDTASVDYSYVTVIANSAEIFAEVPPLLNQAMLERAGRDPQTDFYHVDFAAQNHVKARFRMGNIVDFRQKIQFSGAGTPGNYYIYTEQVVDIEAEEKSGFSPT